MRTFAGIVRKVTLASYTPQEHEGYVLDCGKWFPIVSPGSVTMDSFLNKQVKIKGTREGLTIHGRMIEVIGTGQIWSV